MPTDPVMRSHELTLRARYLFPVDGPPIDNGAVSISGERISYVGPADRAADLDLGNAAVLPGLVCAHTHLELSTLRARDLAGSSFPEWLRHVIESRRGLGGREIAHAVERGIDASLAAGTTMLADISTGGQSWWPLARSPLRATVFCELLGLSPARAAETAQSARSWLGQLGFRMGGMSPADVNFRFEDGTVIDPLPARRDGPPLRRLVSSVSPHAPYSTHPLLYELAATWGRQATAPLCTHLAETSDELQLLEHQAGPLRELLESIAAWNDSWKPSGPSPLDYVTGPNTGKARWVIVHANYLTDEQIAGLGRGGNTAARAVVYCPRTHAFFGHPPHPYCKLLAAGVTVCLGTDSLASSPTLSVLEEMRFLHARDQSLSGREVLRMATLEGARALGQENHCGSLTPGKLADLAVVRLPDRDQADPYLLLLESDEPVLGTMIGGQFVFQLRL